MSDTYNPPNTSDEIIKIVYDFGYREAKIGNGFWTAETILTLESFTHNMGNNVAVAITYSLGYSHGLNVIGYSNFPNRTTSKPLN